ncbi:MAG: GNAT family N-acetyltransferase [Gemmatimonadota bacterium]|nr:GNAT family N-acetyltransferase [Gemmatimonadota bacterium]
MGSLSGFAAAVEERLLVPTYGSRWPFAPIAAHRGLSLPLQLTGPVRAGTVVTSDGPVRVVGIGRDKLIAPLVAHLFGREADGAVGRRRALWNPTALTGYDADLVVAEVHRWMAPRFRRAGWIIVPDAVRWAGDLAHVPGPSPSHSLRQDLRKVARAGFTLTQSTAPDAWEMFATRMVAPQARARFGAEAWIPSRALLRTLMRVGTLHLIWWSGELVSGVCSVLRGDTVWFPVSGVRDGDPELFRRGAGLAVYVLPFAWARTAGYRRIDVGRTGPFIHDGVQQVKRKWGLLAESDPLVRVVAMRIGSEGARRAFAREPVLVEGEEGLCTYRGDPT